MRASTSSGPRMILNVPRTGGWSKTFSPRPMARTGPDGNGRNVEWVARFLSPAWVEAIDSAAAGAALPDDLDVTVAHVVTGGPNGDVTYVLRVRGGRASAALSE